MTVKKISSLLTKLPDAPGIYLFYNRERELIYIGKATSLRSRVRSYFRGARSPRPIEEMIHEVANINWKETDSALEAVILEAIYIKKFLPKYNVLGKDNKSWNYIIITRDRYPRVYTMRQREYASLKIDDSTKLKAIKLIFGPYPGLNTKAAMKLLRRIFNFSNCAPAFARESYGRASPGTGRPCMYFQMGQCPGVCTGDITAEDYQKKIIRPLVVFLQGKKKVVIKMFEREMKMASKEERFEEAARIRNQISALNRIQDIALINKTFVADVAIQSGTLRKIQKNQPPDRFAEIEMFGGRQFKAVGAPAYNQKYNGDIRVEGYDISNLGAIEKVASLVVFDKDGPEKKSYRKFIIRSVPGQSDVDSLEEVLTRRLRHTEWPLPTAFLVDGGRPQVNRAVAVLNHNKVIVPVVGIAKGPKRRRNDFILGNKNPDFIRWVSAHKKLLIQVRDEAHRFAITFHRRRRDQIR